MADEKKTENDKADQKAAAGKEVRGEASIVQPWMKADYNGPITTGAVANFRNERYSKDKTGKAVPREGYQLNADGVAEPVHVKKAAE